MKKIFTKFSRTQLVIFFSIFFLTLVLVVEDRLDPIIIFFETLLILIYFYHYSEIFSEFIRKLQNFIHKISVFRNGIRGSRDELPKFAIVRILFGLLILNRFYYIWLLSYPSDAENLLFQMFLYLDFFLGLSIFLGFATQWALIFMFVFQWQIGENVLQTATLGNDIAAILALLLLLTNSGRHLSVDRVILSNFPQLEKLFLYFEISTRDIISAKFIVLFCYWLICLYSLAQHLNEPAWMEGFAGAQLLTNNFMSRYHDLIVILFETSPLFLLLAKYSMWVMLPWYAFVLPFVILGGYFRTFIIFWGILFFVISNFVLQLGWLAEFEWLLWASLFLYNPKKVEVAYDDKCNLCDRTVQFIKFVDLLSNVKLKPVSQNEEWLLEKGIDVQSALDDLQGWDATDKQLFSGYDLYTKLSKTVPLLMFFWPVLIFGKLTKVGPAVYRAIAKRRIDTFGVCKLPSPKKDWGILTGSIIPKARYPLTNIATVHILFLGFFYLIAIPTPFLGWNGLPNKIAKAAHVYGITPINVFNETDLRMTENWFVLTDENGQLIPIFNKDGSRGWYHKSDRIYFGATLVFRREVIDKVGCHINDDFWRSYMNRFVELHLQRGGKKGDYYYTQYFQAIADANLIKSGRYQSSPIEVICQETI